MIRNNSMKMYNLFFFKIILVQRFKYFEPTDFPEANYTHCQVDLMNIILQVLDRLILIEFNDRIGKNKPENEKDMKN